MAMTREKFFECTFHSEVHHETALMRAWTAADAKRAFLDLLAEEGIREAGAVSVTPVRPQAPVLPARMQALQPRHA